MGECGDINYERRRGAPAGLKPGHNFPGRNWSRPVESGTLIPAHVGYFDRFLLILVVASASAGNLSGPSLKSRTTMTTERLIRGENHFSGLSRLFGRAKIKRYGMVWDLKKTFVSIICIAISTRFLYLNFASQKCQASDQSLGLIHQVLLEKTSLQWTSLTKP